MPCATVVGDVRSTSDMRAAVEEATTQFGSLDAAVAAAGVISGGPLAWEIPDAQWEVQFDINVKGVRNLVGAAVPAMLASPKPRHGRVVAISSTAGVLGLPRLSAYSASKHAVIGYVRSLAADLAGSDITANVVCPGSTRGPMLDASAAVYDLPTTRRVRHAPPAAATARAGGARRLDRLVVQPGVVGPDGGRAPGRRRHDRFITSEGELHGRVHPSGPDCRTSTRRPPRVAASA